jgi:type II secretory ATPase GspE/PulE/Tfp pilus assembly ATPase PilB-like protein
MPAPTPPFTGDSLARQQPIDAFRTISGYAAAAQASDLFFLSEEAALSLDAGRNILNAIKAEAGIELGDRRRPREGRWLERVGDHDLDLRINIIPTLHGEDVAARLHDRKFGLRRLDQLGMIRSELNKVEAMLNSPAGLILVTGAVGTGKTTTLYACLQHINNGDHKINTLEDPVEYSLPGLRQSQVNSRIGLDFHDLLRNVLRQSADVIMIGEIRDEETANTAVRAANSGTLVLSTLHAPVAASAVQSMAALGVNRYFLSNGLMAVIAQRLVRTLCSKCRVPFDISESKETFADIQPLLEPGLGGYIFGPGACDECRRQGYNGRTGLFEVMEFNRPLRELVASGCSAQELQRAAINHGMIEFRRAAMVRVAQGITTTEEVLRELPADQLGLD